MADSTPQQPPISPQETQGTAPIDASGQTAKTSRSRRLIVIIVAVVVVLGLAGGGLALNQARINAEATQSAQSTATMEEQIERTATADAQNTATAQVEATATMRANVVATRYAQGTARAQSTEQATSLTLAQARSTDLLFGPRSGSLVHSDDGFLEYYQASPRVRDFVAEVSFEVPFPSSVNRWDFGFLFRHSTNSGLGLFVLSDGSWVLIDWAGDDWTPLRLSRLNVHDSEGAINTLTLIATGDSGQLFMNDAFVANLDLSARDVEGYISLAIGFCGLCEVDGEATRYFDFSVRRAP